MSPVLIGILTFVLLLILIIFGMPVAFALILVGLVGLWGIIGLEPALVVIGTIPFTSVTLYSLTVVPLFVFMGNLVYRAEFGRDVYWMGRQWVGQFPGGLAQATVLGNAFFGAACGSTVAAAATFGKIAVPEMRRYGYADSLACGSVASAGPIASMIPPSIFMVLYAMVTEQSVGKLLIAGFFPGFLTAFVFMASIWFRCWRNPSLGGAIRGITWKERFTSLKGILGIGFIALCVMGGIYTGFVTPTEAGAIGAFGAFALGFATRRLNLRSLWESLLDTAKTIGMIFAIVVGAFIFSTQFTVTLIPQLAVGWIMGQGFSPLVILIGLMILYIILGTFMDTFAMLFVTMPVVYPIALALGWHPIWFGILITHVFEIAMITPPYGITLFATKSVVEDVSSITIIRGIVPFIFAGLVVLALLIAFPDIALFLPSTMK